MRVATGLVFNRSSGGATLHSVEDINRELAEVGAKIWPLDLSGLPDEMRVLLDKPAPTPAEAERLKAHLLLPRERLLEVIREAGREPHVEGGGSLTTFVEPHNYAYPQLYLAEEGVDYTRFDRLHVNAAEDGTAVDEILQCLVGGPINFLHLTPNGETLHLSVKCPNRSQGWLLTYDGGAPHSGRIGDASPGSKALVQVIGPPRWIMDYDVPQGEG